MDQKFTFFPELCINAGVEVADMGIAYGEELFQQLWNKAAQEPPKRRPHLLAAVIMAMEVEMRKQLAAYAALNGPLSPEEAVRLLNTEIETKRLRAGATFRRGEREFVEEILSQAAAPAGTVLQ